MLVWIQLLNLQWRSQWHNFSDLYIVIRHKTNITICDDPTEFTTIHRFNDRHSADTIFSHQPFSLLIPAESNVLPNEVDLSVQLAKNLKLNIPIIDSTIGTPLIRYLVINPSASATVCFGVKKNGSMITPLSERFTLLTSSACCSIVIFLWITPKPPWRAIAIAIEDSVTVSIPLITAPEGTSLEKAEAILQQHKIEKLPIVNEAGELTGLITIKDIEKVVEFSCGYVSGDQSCIWEMFSDLFDLADNTS